MARPTLSLVIPCYNEEAVIPELHRRLQEFLEKVGVSWEVVLINDGSKDRTHELLKEMCAEDERYKLISFARNFGHQLAITAGIDYAHGDAVVIMDADLQDPPEVVAEMLQKWREGYDIVYGKRLKREKESVFKLVTAAVFYRLLERLFPVPIPVDTGDFRLMSRRAVLTLRALKETHRFVRGMVAWVGFKQTAVEYHRAGRFAGETHYPLHKMIRFALDGITSFSSAPLKLATWAGAVAGGISVLVAGWAIVVGLVNPAAVPGWTTLMVGIAAASSVQLLMMGILGEYIGRIYDEVKNRPLYIISEEVNAELDELAPGGLSAARLVELHDRQRPARKVVEATPDAAGDGTAEPEP